MRLTAVMVVAGWGAANGLLTALLAGMGGSAVVVAIYGAAVFLVEVVAVAVLLSRRRRPSGLPALNPPVGSAVLLAAAVTLAGLGLPFGWWLTILAIPMFVAAAVYETYEYRRRASS